MPKFAQKNVFLQMPKSHFWVSPWAKFWDQKMAKFEKIFWGSKCPQKSFWSLLWPKFAYLGGQNCPFGGVKNFKICTKCCFLHMPPKVILGLPWPKFVKFSYLGSQKCPNLQNFVLCSKFPQKSFFSLLWPIYVKFAYLGDQNVTIWGSKMQKVANKMFC